ncbi:MAG: MBL fold metallo-hydrolase [Calditrichaeota bacterium]|nr:MAG: MBL fold metallo-hydrolase [Calditrichota bacterium]
MSSDPIRYCSVGEVSRIGASAHYLRLGPYGFLLDAGLDPQAEAEFSVPDYERIKNEPVHAILITHAHLDHIGSLPVAIRYFPRARVYMTPATADLTEHMLRHHLYVSEKKARERRIKFEPLYTDTYLESIRYLYQSFDYGVPFPLHGSGDKQLRFTFYDAGHILGSAGVLIEWRGRRFFYTGNTRRSAQFLLRGGKYPRQVDVLITEATYGADEAAEKTSMRKEVARFARLVAERLRFGGIVLIPVFALGRTQEMLTLLQRLRMQDRLPAVPIYLTGFGLQINRIYDRLLHKIYPQYNHGTLRSMLFGRLKPGQRIQGPAVLLSTSGMMIPGSPSYGFARELAAEARNGIFFVGYADPETPGGLFQQGHLDRLKSMLGLEKIAARIERFYFSAHSHRRELLQMIAGMKPSQILLTHGEPQALHWMEQAIRRQMEEADVFIPRKGRWYELLNGPIGTTR